MHAPDDGAMFVGADETSRVDLNYCFNAFVAPYPVQTLKTLAAGDEG